MKKDAEAIQQLFAWLLQESDSAVSVPSGERSSAEPSRPNREPNLDQEESRTVELPSDYLAALDTDPVDGPAAAGGSSYELSSSPLRRFSSLKFGEIPAVQDRFHTLLKRRLRAEIERNPPRFPWETGAYDYEAEATLTAPDLVPTRLWSTQLQALKLPVPMPERVLQHLFEQCRAVLQSSLQEGTRLVQVVESLFPGQSHQLNHLAGLMLTGAARSGSTTLSPAATAKFPRHYDAATPVQQMVLSLLAAQELLETMTLTPSALRPTVNQQWLTDVGAVSLTATYQAETQHLRIVGQLPCGGSLRLVGAIAEASATSGTAGQVSVELFNVLPGQAHGLEVDLQGDEPALAFRVIPTA